MFARFLLTALLLVIVPMLVQQSQSIIQKLPQFADYIHRTALPWFNQKFGHYISLNNETAANWLRSNAQTIQTRIQQALPALMQSGASLATSLSNIVLLPLFAVLLFAGIGRAGKRGRPSWCRAVIWTPTPASPAI